MRAYDCNPNTRWWRHGDQKFKVIVYKFQTDLGYMRSYIKIKMISTVNMRDARYDACNPSTQEAGSED